MFIMADSVYCNLCLATKVKMFKIHSSAGILEAYHQVLQVSPSHDQEKYVCFICARLLQKYSEFRVKCNIAHNVLKSIYPEPQHSQDTGENITIINRSVLQLDSNLRKSGVTVYNDKLQIPEKCSENFEKIFQDETKFEEDLSEIKSEDNKFDGPVNVSFTNGMLNCTDNDLCEADEYLSDFSVNANVSDTDGIVDYSDNTLCETDDYLSDYGTNANKSNTNHEISDTDNDLCEVKKYSSSSNVKKIKEKTPTRNLRSKKKSDKQAKNTSRPKLSIKRLQRKLEEKIRRKNAGGLDEIPLAKLSREDDLKKGANKTVKQSKKLTKAKRRKSFDASIFENYATITLLTDEEMHKEVYLRKETINYVNSKFKCNLCYRGFENKITYENHKKKHSSAYGAMECEFCHLKFISQRNLNNHLESRHKRKFTCQICPYICFGANQAKSHMLFHQGKKYECDQCDEKFRMPNTFLKHRRMKHPTAWDCGMCGACFTTKRGLHTHTSILHRNETNAGKGPKCDECDLKFATELAYKRHLVLSSKHKVSNGCDICGEAFPDLMSLKEHSKNHERRSKTYMKVPVSCSMCDDILEDTEKFKSHVLSEHPLSLIAKEIAVKQRSYVCEVCGKTYKMESCLRTHQRSHREFPPSDAPRVRYPRQQLACDLCQRLYSSSSSLQKHVKTTHQGIRPHKCVLCDRTFSYASDVKAHIKYTHCKISWPKKKRKQDDSSS